MILNEVMDWCGYHMFEFEFYHKELRLIEGADEFVGIGPFDYLEASTTFIREFMEENDWFTYTYDFGGDWQHRVTIEKTIDNWEFNYPQVIKYKGDCLQDIYHCRAGDFVWDIYQLGAGIGLLDREMCWSGVSCSILICSAMADLI